MYYTVKYYPSPKNTCLKFIKNINLESTVWKVSKVNEILVCLKKGTMKQ